MKYYVTLFDSNYLTRGLVMYRSLRHYAGEFHLWIICFDDLAYEILDKLNLERVTLVSLEQFEDEELLRIKSGRTRAEYCWTCTPSTLLYVLNTERSVDSITYLDADLMFFSSPEPIFEEAGDASIILTEHRFSPELKENFSDSGNYNVQFMFFRRDSEGLQALKWWRDRCIEWCFARYEDNKFGDQKYLDDWLERFNGVHVVQHLGAGLAPWNANQYNLQKRYDQIYVNNSLVIFYHFHALELFPFDIGFLCRNPMYILGHELKRFIYYTYFKEIQISYRLVRDFYPKFHLGISKFSRIPHRPRELYKFIESNFNSIQNGRFVLYGISNSGSRS
jgi:hypothetical protein